MSLYAHETVQLIQQETPDFISPDLCLPNSPVDYWICGLMQERVYIVQPPEHDTNRCYQWLEQRLIDIGKHITKRHRLSSWSTEKAVTCKHEGKMTSLWTYAKLKFALFRANTLHNRLFSEPPTVYRGKHVVLHHFHHSYLKANKVSKSEGTRKVKYMYQF